MKSNAMEHFVLQEVDLPTFLARSMLLELLPSTIQVLLRVGSLSLSAVLDLDPWMPHSKGSFPHNTEEHGSVSNTIY
jgi:hypothetical protein